MHGSHEQEPVDVILPDMQVYRIVNVAERGAPAVWEKEVWRERINGMWHEISPPIRKPFKGYTR